MKKVVIAAMATCVALTACPSLAAAGAGFGNPDDPNTVTEACMLLERNDSLLRNNIENYRLQQRTVQLYGSKTISHEQFEQFKKDPRVNQMQSTANDFQKALRNWRVQFCS